MYNGRRQEAKTEILDEGQRLGLLTDNQWAAIEGRLCLVTNFDPWAKPENGRIRAFFGWATPYACVQLKCENSTQDITGFISHKTEFAMLWAAFNKRTEVPGTWLEAWSPEEYNPDGLGENEEVWLLWTRKNYLAANDGSFLSMNVHTNVYVVHEITPACNFEFLATLVTVYASENDLTFPKWLGILLPLACEAFHVRIRLKAINHHLSDMEFLRRSRNVYSPCSDKAIQI